MSQLTFAFAAQPRAREPAPRLTRPLFVVPTERHVERFTGAGYAATTFPALEERMLARAAPAMAIATRAEERAALSIVAPRLPGLSNVDAGSAELASACEAALDDLADFVDDLDPRRVPTLGGRAMRGPQAARVRFLAALEVGLRAELARHGLVARRDLASRLSSALGGLPPETVAEIVGAHVLETRLLVDVSPRRLLLLKTLDRKLGSLKGRAGVCVPSFERPVDPSRAQDPLEAVASWTASWLDDAPRTEPVPARLGYLDELAPPPEVAVGVELRSAVDAESHGHAVADAVVDALAGGACLDAIAIGYARWNDLQMAAIARALEESGLPSHGLARSPAALRSFVFEALAALETPGPRTFAALLGSPYVDLGLSPAEARRRLPRLVRALGRAPRLERGSTRASLLASLRAASHSAVAEADVAVVQRVLDAIEAFPPHGTMAELSAATLGYLRALGVDVRAGRADTGAFATDEADPLAALERDAVARDARSWAELEDSLAALAAAAHALGTAEVVLGRARFVEELGVVYPLSSALPGASRSFALRVGKLSDFAGEELDLLVVLDAAGRLSKEPRSPLVTRELLRALGSGTADEAKALGGLALAASRAERVVFTSAAAEDDAPAEVAPVVPRLVRAGAQESKWGAGSRLDRPLTATDERVRSLLSGGAPDAELAPRVAAERAREGFFLDEKRPLSPAVGALSLDPAIARALAEETGLVRPLALTGLERLAECGFRGFAHVVLGARDAPEDSDLPTAREEGSSLHGALAAALTGARGLLRRRPRDGDAIVREGLRAAEAFLSDSATAGPLAGLLDLRVLHAVSAVLREAVDDEDWDFEVAEQAFGEIADPSSWPALALADGQLRVRGRIDRVDVGHLRAAARVIDYKRGSVDDVLRKVGDTALQVPLYALAVREPTHADSVKGIYLSLKDAELARPPNPKRRGEDAVDRALVEGTAVASAIEAVARVRAGDLAPRPAVETQCRTCGLEGGCRRPRFAMPAEEEEAYRGAGLPTDAMDGRS